MINWGDVLVLAVLALIVGAVITKLIRDKKKGTCCGCSSCKGCSMGCSAENNCGCSRCK